MDNRVYLDMLIVTGMLDKSYAELGTAYSIVSDCNVSIKDIGNIGLKHKNVFGAILVSLSLIIQKCNNEGIIAQAFKELYRLYKVYDKYMTNVAFDMMVRNILSITKNMEKPMNTRFIKSELDKLRIKEVYSEKYPFRLDNKMHKLERVTLIGDIGIYFKVNNHKGLYSMFIDYDGESILYKKEEVPDNRMKLAKIRELNKDKINLLLVFYDPNIDIHSEVLNE